MTFVDTSGDLVSCEIQRGVATIVLRRSDKLNSMNDAMIAQLLSALDKACDSARVAVIRAEPGVRVFSAGHDLSEVAAGFDDPALWDNPVESLLAGLPRRPIPVIAAVEGSVWGAACNLVVAADLVVACRDATFAITPAKLGVPYFDDGVAAFLAALPVHIAKEMFLTARPLSAEDAHRWGMVNRLVADEVELTEVVAHMAATIAELAPLTLRTVKAQFAAMTASRPADEAERAELLALRQQAWRSEDFKEGVAAFGERRKPEFEGR